MEINKIKKKYCTDDKVQVMFSNAPSQIICSKDGYLYLRVGDVIIHRYLTDPIRQKMPYRNHPSSKNHATHLFKYNQIYAKFTRYRNMNTECILYPEESYSLTFLYFVRAENGEALCAELSLEDFTLGEEEVKVFSSSELKDYLYNIENVDAKCIFEWSTGIQFVGHKREKHSFINNDFLDISDEEIVRKYNLKNEPMYCMILDEKKRQEAMQDKSWQVHSIEEVKDFVLTHHGFLEQYSPMILVIDGDAMYVYDFRVTFCEKDCFKVASRKRTITLSYDDVLRYANNCKYPRDPDFDE